MHVIDARNVNDALAQGVHLLQMSGRVVSPRGKRTIEFPGPVTTVYWNPEERVLFLPERDANPFLHFFEALWMLAGRRDLKFIQNFTKNFDQFSTDGVALEGSYGYRWRNLFGYDQLWPIIDLLRKDPDNRRAVLTMWNATADLGSNEPDIPCNTHVYFKIRNDELEMTVCNRSNDIILGAYGANAVHMSMLQEYMADKLGVKMGRYRQMSDNFHAYLEGYPGRVYMNVLSTKNRCRDLYATDNLRPMKMNAKTTDWDDDLATFFELVDAGKDMPHGSFRTAYFAMVVRPMWLAHKNRDVAELVNCQSWDWQIACREWLERRSK